MYATLVNGAQIVKMIVQITVLGHVRKQQVIATHVRPGLGEIYALKSVPAAVACTATKIVVNVYSLKQDFGAQTVITLVTQLTVLT